MKRIFLQYPNGKMREVLVAGSDTVGKVMSMYPFQEDTGAKYNLCLWSNLLEDDKTFSEICILDGDVLQWAERMCGGGCSFGFNSLDNPVIQAFGSELPMWRHVPPGISFKSKCKNPQCLAYNDAIFVSKGFGHFNIAKESAWLDCPKCGTRAESATNCGYWDAKVTFTGRTTEGEDKTYSDVASDGKYHTFKEADDTDWTFLEVEVERLK